MGGNLCRLRHKASGIEILRSPPSLEHLIAQPEMYGIPVLLPPNRIDGGKFRFQGRDYTLPVNEPDSWYWANDKYCMNYDFDGDNDKVEEYIILYNYFAAGISDVTDKIRIGGPSVATSFRFMEAFLIYAASGNNSVT